jgi:hypothetical protein
MQEQQATIAKQQKQQKQIESFTTGLQKASAQVEASKFATGRIRGGGPAPQTVAKTRADCGATGYGPFAAFLSYTIDFTASGGKGGTCQGNMKVCVPNHSQGSALRTSPRSSRGQGDLRVLRFLDTRDQNIGWSLMSLHPTGRLNLIGTTLAGYARENGHA